MAEQKHTLTLKIVRTFLESNLSILLIVLAVAVGGLALLATPREEDPQIIVPMADVLVAMPGHSAEDVERLVATPLEKLLYQIDGVEHVYSMSRTDGATVTVRFYVGQDRERSLIKLYNKIQQNTDIVPMGVTGWVVKPIEIDDVPIVTFTLTSMRSDDFHLRRTAEELAERLAANPLLSRVTVVGGRPRQVRVVLKPDRLSASVVDVGEVASALQAANVMLPAGAFDRNDANVRVDVGQAMVRADELASLVVAVHDDRPVRLCDVAEIVDGPAEPTSYVRLGFGPSAKVERRNESPGSVLGGFPETWSEGVSTPAVTLAVAKKKGTNAVHVAESVIQQMDQLRMQRAIPDDMAVVITRNAGLTADEKVNELVEALGVAILIVIALLAVTLGGRQAMIVCVAVPIVFGLTLAINMLAGYTINRVTLFALILAMGLLVDDPIVDVENIHRHFRLRRRASRGIVLDAVNEVRPPLITATLAVMVSFLPMMFITGMMGPYMQPMALNVPITMLMSMLVSFTVTPWLSYHLLKGTYRNSASAMSATSNDLGADSDIASLEAREDEASDRAIRASRVYRLFRPMMEPLLRRKRNAWAFLAAVAALMAFSVMLAADRKVPLKMLPFDNKNELNLVLDFDEGTTLERSDAVVRQFEEFLRTVGEVTDFECYVGTASPMDFNGMVRHYYHRSGPNVADIRVNLVPKRMRTQQSHALALRLRPALQELADANGVSLKIVETPPGPPVIQTLTAEVFGPIDADYSQILDAARRVRHRMSVEPGVMDLDDSIESAQTRTVFVVDKEKAGLNGVTTQTIASTVQSALAGRNVGLVHAPSERQPLMIELRFARADRSSTAALSQIHVKSATTQRMVPLAEFGQWQTTRTDQTIYHKDLRRVAYVFADAVGRPPADIVLDIQADRRDAGTIAADRDASLVAGDALGDAETIPLHRRTFYRNGGGALWTLPSGFDVRFSGEGEWQITIDVFRDMGLAYIGAMIGIYILLVYQTRSFLLPVVVMLAIPLTIIGIMPGFWLMNHLSGTTVAGLADPVFFTATAMIGMIALAGIVTRDAIILVDFIHLSLARGKSLFDAIMESRVVRLRPILLTSATAMLGALPITFDPIFSGLAWSLIFGLFASTLFTLFVIPVAYWLIYARRDEVIA